MDREATMLNIWQFQKKLINRLLAWAGLSFALGIIFSLQKDKRLQGVGSQFTGWAVVNTAIAYFSARAARAKEHKVTAGELPERETVSKEAHNLYRLLWVNAGLDILYILCGYSVRVTKGRADRRILGIGEGIALQGAALFILDLFHVLLVPELDS